MFFIRFVQESMHLFESSEFTGWLLNCKTPCDTLSYLLNVQERQISFEPISKFGGSEIEVVAIKSLLPAF